MTGSVPFTPRSKKVLELSLREALRLGHNYIGTEHILLGLVREGEGVAVRVLAELGAEPLRVTARVLELLQGHQAAVEAAVVPGQAAGPPVGKPPFCPHCHSALGGSLRYANLRATGTGPYDPAVEVTFVFCAACGRALGSGGGSAPGPAAGGGPALGGPATQV